MATTVAQHSVATFTSPVNGTTPIDANTVRGNDNTTRAAYNDHDADPGIHVQSSTLASRPVAGTAGRKWITEDSGVYTLWFDDGTNWHPVSSENVALTVLAGENLVKGDVVKVTGWNNGQDLPEVVKTTSAADTAFAVITATVSSGSMGYATNTGIVQDVNTAAYSVGTILYANGSGGFTSTKPTSGNYQPVAYVLRSNTNNGVYYVEFSTPRIVERSDNTASTVVLRDSNGDFSAGTITATAVNATTLDLTNLEVTNIKAKDGTQAIAIADTTGKLTISDGVLLSALTASQAVFTDGSKNLVSNAITGTGNVVMSASPTLTGTVTAATLNATTLGGTLSTAAQPNVTSVGTLSSLAVSGTGSFGGLLSANSNSSGATVSVVDLNNNASGANTFASLSFNTAATAYATIAGGYGASAPQMTFNLPSVTAGNYVWQISSSEVMRLAANGNLAVDTNTLYVDAANNRVGVGTASPSHPFQISSTTLIVDTAGNLGLGVTPSAWSASSRTMDVGAFTCFGQNTAGAALVAFNTFQNSAGTYTYKTTNPSARYDCGVNGTDVHAWYTAPSGTAGNAITFTERLRVDATTTAGQTALLLWDVDNGTLERVTVGAADSGGAGFKVLRIPN